MNDFYQSYQTDVRPSGEVIHSYINRIFSLMAFGLGFTGLMAYITLNFQPLLVFSVKFRMLFFIGEIGMVIYLAARVLKMDPKKALMWFYGYAALNGITLTPIFLIYTNSAIYSAFFISALMFGGMAVWGYTTKSDLTSLGGLCSMGLWGIIIASVVNIFLGNAGMQMIISYIAVGVFIGLTAWDVQKLKNIAMTGQMTGGLAVLGALQLYLDFINLFLNILYIMGGRRD